MPIAKETLDALIGLSIALGITYCFLGYKLFKIILGILGFSMGATLGGALANSSSGGEGGSTLIAALLAGAIGAALFVGLYFVGTFLLGAAAGALLVVLFFQVSGSVSPPIGFILIPAILGGILAVILQKFAIIVSTSFAGSWTVVTGVLYFAEPHTYRTIAIRSLKGVFRTPDQLGLTILLWILLGSFGVVVQYRHVEKSKVKGASKLAKGSEPEIETEGADNRTTAAQIGREGQQDSEPLDVKPVVNKRGFLILESQPDATRAGDTDERQGRKPAEPDEDEYNF